MTYDVRFMPKAAQDIARIDKTIAQRILNKLKWLSENLNNLTSEPLTGDLRELYKLRVGSYRVVYAVDQKARFIVVHLVGHRRDIYKLK